jgi:hypothetical protein
MQENIKCAAVDLTALTELSLGIIRILDLPFLVVGT